MPPEKKKVNDNISSEILDIVSDPTSFVGKDYRYKYVNAAYCRFFNREREEIIGRTVEELIGKENFESTVKPHFDRCIEGEHVSYINTIKAEAGQNLFLLMDYYPYYDDKGNIDGLISTAKDITEDAVLKSDWLKTINSIDDVLLIINKDFEIEDINDRGLSLLNKKYEDVIGRKCYEVIHNTDKCGDFCPLCLSAKTRKTETVERHEKIFNKYFSIKSSPVFNEKGEIEKFVDVMRDITDYKAKENDLDLKNQQLAASTEEYYAINEELQKQNEEYTALNEEYIAANEELRQQNEEYAALMEEYVTTNEELKEKTLKLAESEEKFRLLFENMNEAFALHKIITDEGGNPADYEYIDINPMFENLLGVKREDIIGKRVLEIYPSTEKYWIETYGKTAMEGTPVKYVNHFSETDRYYDVNVFSPRKGFFAVIFTDITEKKQITRQIEEERDFNRMLVETSPVAIVNVNKEGQIDFANKYAETLLGLTKDNLDKKTYNSPDWNITDFEGNPFDEEKLPFSIVKSTLEPVYGIEHAIEKSNGERVYLTINASPFLDENGCFDGMLGTINDITERISVTRELAKTKERLELAAKSAGIGVWDLDLRTDRLIWDDRMYDIYGIEKKTEDEVFDLWKGSVHPEDLEEAVRDVENAAAGEKGYDSEFRIVRPDGTIRYIKANAVVLKDKNNTSLRMLGTNLDITIRKRAEEELRKSKETAESYLNIAAELIISIDEFGCIAMLNDNGCNLLGYKKYELIGKNWFDTCLPDYDVENVKSIFKKLMKGKLENTEQVEGKVLTKSGEERTILWHNSLLKDENGRITGTLSSGEDITERKIIEEALKESEVRFRTLFENAGDSISIIDGGKYIECNEAALKVFGCEAKSDIIGKSPWDFSPKHQPCGELSNIKAMAYISPALEGEPQQFHWKHSKKDGTPIDTEVTLNRLNIGDSTYVQAIVRDITERLQTETELKDNKERLENIIRGTNAGTWEWNVKTGEITVNERWAEIMGYTLKEVSPTTIETWEKFVHPDDLSSAYKMLEKHFNRENDYYECEFRLRHKNGSWVWILDRGKVIVWDDEKKPLLMYGTHQDITERKQSEEAIKREKMFSDLLIESLPGIFYMIDSNMRFVRWNHNKAAFHGLDDEGMKTHQLLDAIADEDKEKLVSTAQEVFTKGEANEVIKIIRHDGEIFSYQLTGKLIIVDEEPMLLGVGIDVTDRINAELELKESEERFRKYIEFSPTPIFIADRETNYTYVNHSACSLLGYSFEELTSMKIKDISYNLEPRQIKSSSFTRLIQDGSISNVETKLKCKDGHFKDVIIDAVRISENQLIAFCKDISEIKRYEEEIIEAKQRAEESDRLKSAFLANMSHEIRTPMNGIMGFAELLKDPELTENEEKEYVEIIQNSGKRMLNIINDLIDISKIEAGEIELFIQETPLNTVLRDLHTFFKPQADKKGLAFSYESCFEDAETIIMTDRTKLNQILSNLINNAIKFTSKGSVTFGCDIKGNMIEFYVKDTGKGIEKDYLDIIFERFRQADMETSRQYEGAGLGLSISKGFVEMMGGIIWAESKPGAGSAFYFTIPFKSAESKKEDMKQEAPQQITSADMLTVLIAEDDFDSFLLLKKMLKDFNGKILHADNGRKAVDIALSNQKVDLVLMDIKMPVMNGYDAARKIKENKPDLPVIAQTAYALKSDMQAALDAGCDDYISKPIIKNDLLKILEKYLKMKQP